MNLLWDTNDWTLIGSTSYMTSNSLQEIVAYGTMSLRVGPIHSTCIPWPGWILSIDNFCVIHVACADPESFVGGGSNSDNVCLSFRWRFAGVTTMTDGLAALWFSMGPSPPPSRWFKLLSVPRRWFCCWWSVVWYASHWLWGLCVYLWFILHYFASFLDSQSSWRGRKSLLLCFYCLTDVLLL